MEYYNNILCLTYSDLEQVMPYKTAESIVRHRRCTVVRPGYGRDTYALIQWTSLPDKYRSKFIREVGEPADLIRQAERNKNIETMHNAEAVEYYTNYRYDHKGRMEPLPEAKRKEYIINYTALSLLLAEHEKRVRLTKASNNTRHDLWHILQRSSEKLRENYPHTLPKSEARLRVKVQQFKVAKTESPEMGFKFVISEKMGNQNALKITPEGERLLIALKRQRVPVLTGEQIWLQYNAAAEMKGWAAIKNASTIAKWYERPEIRPLWFDAVYGEQKAHQKFDRKHSTELPEYSCTLWYGDGTKLNLYYRDDEGKVATINVYEVIDAASEALIGYHISETEDYEAQYRAFRMAIETAGVRPIEIVYDNQGGHKKLASQEFFHKLAMRHRPTAPYNGASKTIEHAFYRLQSEVMAQHFNFTGQNITAKADKSRPNIEFIEANKNNLPTLEELKAQYAACRKEWNERAHPKTGQARMEMFKQSINPECQRVTERDIIDMFWLTAQRPATYTANGLRISMKGVEHLYEVYAVAGIPDFEWTSQNIDRKFYVQYDPMDINSIRLMSAEKDPGDRRFVRVASQKMVVHRASSEQSSEEKAFIRATRAAIQAERARRVTEGRLIEIEHGVAPEQHGLNSPEPKNLPKELREQMERKLAVARRRKAKEEGLGTYTKTVSLADWRDIEETTFNKDKVRAKY